eukprot:827157-Amphidinium_carterae.1
MSANVMSASHPVLGNCWNQPNSPFLAGGVRGLSTRLCKKASQKPYRFFLCHHKTESCQTLEKRDTGTKKVHKGGSGQPFGFCESCCVQMPAWVNDEQFECRALQSWVRALFVEVLFEAKGHCLAPTS